jgi:predicted porin
MGIYTVKRSLISAIVFGGLVVSAQAADLKGGVADALPAIPDGPITWMGVTFYGTVDVGYAYAENGLPPSGAFYNGVSGTALNAGINRPGSVSVLNNNALTLSNVGIKIEEQLGAGFLAIGKLQTQFNPISGELGDACASLLRFSGRPRGDYENFGDGSRCGQAFADAAYAGLSHPIYGTLTVGRQTNLVADGMGAYDPMSLSPAFSAIGYSGTVGGGIGSTETTRWNNSVKYIATYGPVHAAGMYSNGGDDTPILQDAYGANVGITYMGFSIDGFYTKENAAVNLSGYGYAPGAATLTTCDASIGNCSGYLRGQITNNEAWDVMAKYTFNVPSLFAEPAVSMKDAPCGGLKDAPCAPPPSAKVTLYGGYQYVDQSNPDQFQSAFSGGTTIGGYKFLSGGAAGFADTLFGTDRIRETTWAGISYEDGPWKLVGAYYNWHQNSYRTATAGAAGGCVVSAAGVSSATCSGDFNQGSFLIDYTVNRHFDVYAGVTFTDVNGGIVVPAPAPFATDNTWAFASGVRVKW